MPPIDRDLLKSHTDLLCMFDFIVGIAAGVVRAYLETKKAVPMNNARLVWNLALLDIFNFYLYYNFYSEFIEFL